MGYERAAHVAFGVADAVDDRGTGGHLCLEQTRANTATVPLNQTLIDWVLPGEGNTERKANDGMRLRSARWYHCIHAPQGNERLDVIRLCR